MHLCVQFQLPMHTFVVLFSRSSMYTSTTMGHLATQNCAARMHIGTLNFEAIQFVDEWIGKDAICALLKDRRTHRVGDHCAPFPASRNDGQQARALEAAKNSAIVCVSARDRRQLSVEWIIRFSTRPPRHATPAWHACNFWRSEWGTRGIFCVVPAGRPPVRCGAPVVARQGIASRRGGRRAARPRDQI